MILTEGEIVSKDFEAAEMFIVVAEILLLDGGNMVAVAFAGILVVVVAENLVEVAENLVEVAVN